MSEKQGLYMKLRYKIGVGFVAMLAIAVTAIVIVLSHNSACVPAPAVAKGSATMKAVVYSCYGSPEVLQYTNVEKPVPEDDEVLVKVVAAAVNPLDWHYMRGEPYIMRVMGAGIGAPKDPKLGVDYAGTVAAVGKNVKNFAVGDEVFGGRSGAFAEFLQVRADRGIAKKPANMSFEQAAAVGIAGVTALQALRDSGGLQAGQKVLINGASGGVGTFAVQIAKAMGAEVTGVCSTRNVDMVRSIGADHVIDYKKASYVDASVQYDLILDMVGNHPLLANRKVMTPNGNLVIVGSVSSGNWLGPLKRPIFGAILSSFIDQEISMIMAMLTQDDLVVLADMMEAGKLTPVLGRHFSLKDVPAAIAHSEEGHARGKIIIDIE
jgi:NADPH:quinone reductase-like Zn-dependent oxidoreductase